MTPRLPMLPRIALLACLAWAGPVFAADVAATTSGVVRVVKVFEYTN